MQFSTLERCVFGDLVQRFEAFCVARSGEDSEGVFGGFLAASPILFLVDNPFVALWRVFRSLPPLSTIATSSRGVCESYLRGEGAPPKIQGVLVREARPSFTASWETIVVCFLGVPPLEADLLLKQWAGCLSARGKLFFLMLGEMTLSEILYDPSVAESCPAHLFLSQRALAQIEAFRTTFREEWVRLENPSFEAIEMIGVHIFKEKNALLAPLLSSPLGMRNWRGGGALTLHVLYGEMRRVEREDDV